MAVLHRPYCMSRYIKTFECKILNIFLSINFKIESLGAQKNCLIETALLSTHYICFGWEIRNIFFISHPYQTGPSSAVGNVSGYRCVSDCRSRGREFDPSPVPYFRGDWSWNNFYDHSPPFRWFIQEGLSSVTSESMCTNYWLTTCSSLPRKKCD